MKPTTHNRGSILIMVVGLLTVIALLGTTLLLINRLDRQQSQIQGIRNQADSVAWGVANRIRGALKQDLHVGFNPAKNPSIASATNVYCDGNFFAPPLYVTQGNGYFLRSPVCATDANLSNNANCFLAGYGLAQGPIGWYQFIDAPAQPYAWDSNITVNQNGGGALIPDHPNYSSFLWTTVDPNFTTLKIAASADANRLGSTLDPWLSSPFSNTFLILANDSNFTFAHLTNLSAKGWSLDATTGMGATAAVPAAGLGGLADSCSVSAVAINYAPTNASYLNANVTSPWDTDGGRILFKGDPNFPDANYPMTSGAAMLFHTGVTNTHGDRYYAAVRIIDTSGLVNLNTAFGFNNGLLASDSNNESYISPANISLTAIPGISTGLAASILTQRDTYNFAIPTGASNVISTIYDNLGSRILEPNNLSANGNMWNPFPISQEIFLRWMGTNPLGTSVPANSLGQFLGVGSNATTPPPSLASRPFLTTYSVSRRTLRHPLVNPLNTLAYTAVYKAGDTPDLVRLYINPNDANWTAIHPNFKILIFNRLVDMLTALRLFPLQCPVLTPSTWKAATGLADSNTRCRMATCWIANLMAKNWVSTGFGPAGDANGWLVKNFNPKDANFIAYGTVPDLYISEAYIAARQVDGNYSDHNGAWHPNSYDANFHTPVGSPDPNAVHLDPNQQPCMVGSAIEITNPTPQTITMEGYRFLRGRPRAPGFTMDLNNTYVDGNLQVAANGGHLTLWNIYLVDKNGNYLSSSGSTVIPLDSNLANAYFTGSPCGVRIFPNGGNAKQVAWLDLRDPNVLTMFRIRGGATPMGALPYDPNTWAPVDQLFRYDFWGLNFLADSNAIPLWWTNNDPNYGGAVRKFFWTASQGPPYLMQWDANWSWNDIQRDTDANHARYNVAAYVRNYHPYMFNGTTVDSNYPHLLGMVSKTTPCNEPNLCIHCPYPVPVENFTVQSIGDLQRIYFTSAILDGNGYAWSFSTRILSSNLDSNWLFPITSDSNGLLLTNPNPTRGRLDYCPSAISYGGYYTPYVSGTAFSLSKDPNYGFNTFPYPPVPAGCLWSEFFDMLPGDPTRPAFPCLAGDPNGYTRVYGRINPNTASREVLAALPFLQRIFIPTHTDVANNPHYIVIDSNWAAEYILAYRDQRRVDPGLCPPGANRFYCRSWADPNAIPLMNGGNGLDSNWPRGLRSVFYGAIGDGNIPVCYYDANFAVHAYLTPDEVAIPLVHLAEDAMRWDVNQGGLSSDYKSITELKQTKWWWTSREAIFRSVSNLFTVNSDSFAATIRVQIGTNRFPTNVWYYVALFDRSNCYLAGDSPNIMLFAPVTIRKGQ